MQKEGDVEKDLFNNSNYNNIRINASTLADC